MKFPGFVTFNPVDSELFFFPFSVRLGCYVTNVHNVHDVHNICIFIEL